MTTDFYAAEDILVTNLSKLWQEIINAESRAGIVSLDQSTQGRLSRVDAIQQQAMALANIESKKILIRKVEAAIERCHRGNYGICCGCGERISAERLGYDPATPFCQDCAK